MVVRRFACLCLASLAGLLLSPAAQAQKALTNNDLSFDGFYQFTSTASGNGISDRTSKSAGAAAYFRHSYHWWLGYEAGYGYSRYTEYYTGQIFGIQHNQHEFSGSYYVHGPHTLAGIQPFALAGVSAVIFSPSLNGGQNVAWQARPGINYGAGVNVPLVTSYFGLRLEYRGVFYKTPDFGQPNLTTNAWRNTSEPTAGIYFRF
jgi:opacity protein-like surface antigen